MAFTLQCFTNYEDNNVVNKTLASPPPLTLSCDFKYGINLRQPVVVLSTTLLTLEPYNYFYIPEFGRYYYKVEFKGVSNNLVEATLDCDLLMSFKDEFILSEAIIERNQTRGNVYVPDSMYPIEARTNVVTKKFPSALSTTASMVLVTIG